MIKRLFILLLCVANGTAPECRKPSRSWRRRGVPNLSAGRAPLGESIIKRSLARQRVLDDPNSRGIRRTIGDGGSSHRGRRRTAVRLLRRPVGTLNAFRLPGGYIGVHTGLILAAGVRVGARVVLGHEIAHVTQRHIAQLVEAGAGEHGHVASMLVAVLAARSYRRSARAAVAAGQAGSSSRSSAIRATSCGKRPDRLEDARERGLRCGGMPGFCERLQRAGRLYENNAPIICAPPDFAERIRTWATAVGQMCVTGSADFAEFGLLRRKLR